jgi:hypothetical protein
MGVGFYRDRLRKGSNPDGDKKPAASVVVLRIPANENDPRIKRERERFLSKEEESKLFRRQRDRLVLICREMNRESKMESRARVEERRIYDESLADVCRDKKELFRLLEAQQACSRNLLTQIEAIRARPEPGVMECAAMLFRAIKRKVFKR